MIEQLTLIDNHQHSLTGICASNIFKTGSLLYRINIERFIQKEALIALLSENELEHQQSSYQKDVQDQQILKLLEDCYRYKEQLLPKTMLAQLKNPHKDESTKELKLPDHTKVVDQPIAAHNTTIITTSIQSTKPTVKPPPIIAHWKSKKPLTFSEKTKPSDTNLTIIDRFYALKEKLDIESQNDIKPETLYLLATVYLDERLIDALPEILDCTKIIKRYQQDPSSQDLKKCY